jgi:hypothetical protein
MFSRDAIPFYSNTPDDTHCFQAALRMILKHFLPEQDFSWQQLDEITAKHPGMWTWPMAGLCWLKQNGFDVINIEDFDYRRFCEEKENYLTEKFGSEVARVQVKNSVLHAEIEWAKKFITTVPTQNRLPSYDEIINLALEGYLLIVNVNARTLNHTPGYAGHFIVIGNVTNNWLQFHDPGLPAIKNRKVDRKLFLEAWNYPDEGARNLIAIKPAS